MGFANGGGRRRAWPLVALLGLTLSGAAAPDPRPLPARPATQQLAGKRLMQGTRDEVIAQLAQQLGLTAGDIEVLRQEQVTWPDSSLGCPRPGMAYMQVLVDGLLLVLQARGRQYQFHAGANGRYFFCPDPHPPIPDGGASRR